MLAIFVKRIAKESVRRMGKTCQIDYVQMCCLLIPMFLPVSGYSKDGGLYFPETIPKLSPEQLEAWSKLSYPDLLAEILCLFIDQAELSRDQIKGETHQTLR